MNRQLPSSTRSDMGDLNVSLSDDPRPGTMDIPRNLGRADQLRSFSQRELSGGTQPVLTVSPVCTCDGTNAPGGPVHAAIDTIYADGSNGSTAAVFTGALSVGCKWFVNGVFNGAGGLTYAPVSGDAGKTVKVQVTGFNAFGSKSVFSNSIAII